MKKLKAFTFVELLLVMLILGIIISLTLPIVKNIKDDGDIYRAYMKKANQDVTDAINMIFIKEPTFTGFQSVQDGITAAIDANFNASSEGLRYAFNKGLNTQECKNCTNSSSQTCATDGNCIGENEHDFKDNGTSLKERPGLILSGKPLWLFKYEYNAANGNTEATYGKIYVDMNKDKAPNELCKDRFKFIIYNDRVAMEGCDYSL